MNDAPKPRKKKELAGELKWRRPPGQKFDITPTDRVDDVTWSILDSLCPRRRVLLQYSTGKDSCAAWLELAGRGYTVVPVFKEVFRDLSFFTGPIAAHEEFFKTQVHIVPSKISMFDVIQFMNDEIEIAKFGIDMKDEILYQASSKSRNRRYRALMVDKLLEEFDCDICIIGTKASDSLHRRTHFTVDGPYLPRERLFSLLWRLKKSAPYQIMLDAGLPIPRYYLWLGRSPDFMLPHEFAFIKRFFPEDYEALKPILKNMDSYVTAYEASPALKHGVKPPKILLDAHEKGLVSFV